MEEKIEQRPGERILVWFILVLSIFFLIVALRMPGREILSSSAMFPILITSIMTASVITTLWKNRRRYNGITLGEELPLAQRFTLPKIVVGYIVIIVLYIIVTEPLHFLPSSYLFLIGSFMFLKGATFKKSLLIGALMLAIIYILFDTIFKVILW